MDKPENISFVVDGWPPQAVEILMKMRSEGETLKNIAEELGITRSAVSGKVRRLKLAPLKAPPEEAKKKPKKVFHSPRPRPPTPPAPEPDIPSKPVSLSKLKNWHCRAVLHERGSDTLAMFCGRAVTTKVNGQPASWCSEHYEIYMDLERMNRRHG